MRFVLAAVACVAFVACSAAPAIQGTTPGPTAAPTTSVPTQTVGVTASPDPMVSLPTPARATTTPVPTPAPTVEMTAAPSTPAPTPEPTVASASEVVVSDSGFSVYKGRYDSGYSLSGAAIITNPNVTSWIARDLSVNISLLDSGGGLVETMDESIAAIPPGQSVAVVVDFNYFSNADLRTVKKMDIQVFGDWEEFTGGAGQFTFKNISTRRDSLGDLTTKAQISSTFVKDLDSVIVAAVYYNGDKIVGAGYTYVDKVPSGRTVSFSISGPGARSVDATELYAQLSYISLSD